MLAVRDHLALLVTIVSLLSALIGALLAYGRRTRADGARDAEQAARFSAIDREVNDISKRVDSVEQVLVRNDGRRESDHREMTALLAAQNARLASLEAMIGAIQQRIEDVLRVRTDPSRLARSVSPP
jgi:hypothetical protein